MAANVAGARFMRHYPSLHVGRALTTHCQRQEPVEVHLRQSMMDGACAHHALAMALIAMGLVKRSAVLDMSRRRYGPAAELYAVLADHWMDGVYAAELVEAIQQLDQPIGLDWADGFNGGVDRLTVDSLMQGRLVMLAYESDRNRHRHWLLAIGCGGSVEGRAYTVDCLLTLDPSMDALPFAAGNGHLRLPHPVDFESRKTSVRWLYETVDGAEPVMLMSAISLTLRDAVPSKRRR